MHYNSRLAYGRPFGFPELSLLSSMKLPSLAYAWSPVDRPMRLEFLELLLAHGLAVCSPLVKFLLPEVPSPIPLSFDVSSCLSDRLLVYVVE